MYMYIYKRERFKKQLNYFSQPRGKTKKVHNFI